MDSHLKPTDKWEVLEYENGVVARPIKDKRKHSPFEDCWCNPTVEYYSKPLYIHHSLDWREFDNEDWLSAIDSQQE